MCAVIIGPGLCGQDLEVFQVVTPFCLRLSDILVRSQKEMIRLLLPHSVATVMTQGDS